MAKLPRKTQKIFAENAPVNQVTAFGSVKAGDVEYTKDVGDIQTDAFSTGWAEAVQEDYAPYRQDVNAVYLAITKQLAYQFQEGVAEWDAGTTYFKGGIVKEIIGSEYKLYHSLIDNNINNPLTDTESWKLDFDSTNPFVSLAQLEAVNNSALHKTGNEEKSGNLTLNNSSCYLKDTNIEKAVTPTSNIYGKGFQINDKNNNRLGCFDVYALTNGYWGTRIYTQNANNNIFPSIDVQINADNEIKTSAPEPKSMNSKTDRNIATVGWVNDHTKSLNVLHRDGDEEKSGGLTVNGYLNRKITSAAITDDVTSDIYNYIHFLDKNNNACASLDEIFGSNGSRFLQINQRNKNNTDWLKNTFRVGFDSNGKEFMEAPQIRYRTNFSEKGTSNKSAKVYEIVDSTYWELGREYIDKRTDGGVYRLITAVQNIGENKGKFCGIAMSIKEDGTARMYYTCDATISIPDTGQSIPTMDKVNSRITDLMSSKSIESSGDRWIRFGDGHQMCWGSQNNVGGSVTVTFPQSFISEPYALEGHAYSYSDHDFYVTGTSTTTITINAKGRSGWWLAIGKWK